MHFLTKFILTILFFLSVFKTAAAQDSWEKWALKVNAESILELAGIPDTSVNTFPFKPIQIQFEAKKSEIYTMPLFH